MAENNVPEDVLEKEITNVDVVVESSETTEDDSDSNPIQTIVEHVKKVFNVKDTHPSAGHCENKPTETLVKQEQPSSSVETPVEDIRQKYWTKEGYYSLSGFADRRHMIHFVNETFDRDPDGKLERKGAEKDLKNIQKISTKLEFRDWKKPDKQEDEMNFTKKEIDKSLENFKLQLKDKVITCECFMLVISTHGREERNAKRNGLLDHALYCKDTQLVFTSTILEMFNDENCPQLRGKPKIFIIQACRGDEKDKGVEVAVLEDKSENKMGTENTDAERSSDIHKPPPVSYADASGKAEVVEYPHISVSCYDDMLVMYAIPSKYKAWRNTTDGSWMIHYLHNVVQEYQNYKKSRPTNFLRLLTEVAGRMSKRVSDPEGFKAVPVIEHRLTKHILL